REHAIAGAELGALELDDPAPRRELAGKRDLRTALAPDDDRRLGVARRSDAGMRTLDLAAGVRGCPRREVVRGDRLRIGVVGIPHPRARRGRALRRCFTPARIREVALGLPAFARELIAARALARLLGLPRRARRRVVARPRAYATGLDVQRLGREPVEQ